MGCFGDCGFVGALVVKSCGKDEPKTNNVAVVTTASMANVSSSTDGNNVIVARNAASTAVTNTTASAGNGQIASATGVAMASSAETEKVLVASNASPLAIAQDKASVFYENKTVSFFFAIDKAEVAEESVKVASDVIAAGKEDKKLVISGYTDSTGNAAYNEELAKKRAQAVKTFFEKQGVPSKNIELRKPVNTTAAVGNDVEGRRVDVKIED